MFLIKKIKSFIFISLIIFISFIGHTQEKSLSGNVTTFKTYSLNGVTVESKKMKTSVQTDSLGNFTIECAKKDVLKFKAHGFQTVTQKIKNDKNLEINLIYVEGENSYKDVLKHEYLSKESLDYCVNNLLENNNNFENFATMEDLIQSICPNAKFSEDPEDGREVVTVETRGPNTFFANQDALLVVDGVVVQSITSINPSVVKTIKVLVGNQAGHWGVRGGNGVIEITLKNGL